MYGIPWYIQRLLTGRSFRLQARNQNRMLSYILLAHHFAIYIQYRYSIDQLQQMSENNTLAKTIYLQSVSLQCAQFIFFVSM